MVASSGDVAVVVSCVDVVSDVLDTVVSSKLVEVAVWIMVLSMGEAFWDRDRIVEDEDGGSSMVVVVDGDGDGVVEGVG